MTLQRVTQEDAGEYRCEISAPLDAVSLGETNVTLKVLGIAVYQNLSEKNLKDLCFVFINPDLSPPSVPPHTPSCEIPSAAVTGSVVQLRCKDQQSIPPATYTWFKDDQLMSQPRHANATYSINSHTGVLVSVCVHADKENHDIVSLQ